MISAANIAALEKANIDYILGVRERSIKEVRTEVIEDDGVTIPLVIPRQRGETQLEIKDVTLRGRRYVLCRNEEESRKDAERRAMLLAGLERKLKEGDKALVGNKGFRRLSSPDPTNSRLIMRTPRTTQSSAASSCCAPRPNYPQTHEPVDGSGLRFY